MGCTGIMAGLEAVIGAADASGALAGVLEAALDAPARSVSRGAFVGAAPLRYTNVGCGPRRCTPGGGVEGGFGYTLRPCRLCCAGALARSGAEEFRTLVTRSAMPSAAERRRLSFEVRCAPEAVEEATAGGNASVGSRAGSRTVMRRP